MREKLLITAAAIALLAGTGLASAQMQHPPAATGAPGAAGAQKGGAEPAARMDQGARPDQGAKADKTGQDMKPGSDAAAAAPAPADDGKGKRKGSAEAPSKAKSAQQGDDRTRMGNDGKGRMSADDAKKPGAAADESKKPGAAAEDARKPAAGTAEERPGTGARPGAQGSASATLTTEQRTRIHTTVIKEKNAPRVTNVNFSLSVGTVVPKSVRVVPVPATIVEIQPAWRGFLYFLVGDQVVIVEPGTLRIIAVIAA